MPQTLTLTQLRADLYRIVDEALATGEPVVIVRGDRRLRLIPDARSARRDLTRIPQRRSFTGTPEELEQTSWPYDPTGESESPDARR